MKTKLIMIAALISMAFMTQANKAKHKKSSETIEVTIDSDGEKMVKKVIVNGKELTKEEVKVFEASGKMKVLHMNVDKHGKHEKIVKVIKLNGDKTDGEEDVQVFVTKDNGKMTKKIIVNGEPLSEDEIKEFEKSGKMKGLHMEHAKIKGRRLIKVDGSEVEGVDKHIKNIKKHLGDDESIKWDSDEGQEIEVTIEKDGGNTIEKISMNGKELSDQEIKNMKASGELKVIHLNKGDKGHDMMFFNSEGEGSDVDIEVIMETLEGMDLSSHNGVFIKEIIEGDEGRVHQFIKKASIKKEHDGPTLGFMTMQYADGMHVGYILEGSDATAKGVKQGDLIKKIGKVDFSIDNIKQSNELLSNQKYKIGELVDVVIERNGKIKSFKVEARDLDFSEVMSENPPTDFYKWLDVVVESDKKINKKMMIFDSKDGYFGKVDKNMHIVFPDKFDKMNFFTSDGSSTSKLLGKHHEMSTLSEGMGKYFNTKEGVLVLHVDETNAFALKDGDVIKAINGNTVKSPKDVVKQLVIADDEKKIKIKVIRHKKSKTLKYNK